MRIVTKSKAAVVACLAFALLLTAPTTAGAFSGGLHEHAANQACWLFTTDMYEIGPDRDRPLFPMLNELGWWFVDCDPSNDEGMWQSNWYWLANNAVKADYYEPVYDGYTSDTLTYTHFWEADEGLREDTEGTYKNAWEKAEILWNRACLNWWNHTDLDGTVFSELGYVVHLMTDQGQPAHVHSDLHGPGNRDSLEQACDAEWAQVNFRWMDPATGVGGPGDIWQSGVSNQSILNDIIACGHYADELAESDPVDGDPQLATADDLKNIQQLFWIFYTVNQTADFFASDGAEGETDEPIGWLGGYASFPDYMWHLTGDDSDNDYSWDVLDNNEDACPLAPEDRIKRLCTDDTCDCDGDLSIIAKKGYGAAFRATPAVIDLFRRTIDNVAPVSTVTKERADGAPVVVWNNSPVTVRIVSAVDHGRPYGGGELRNSGVWRKWGTLDGAHPANVSDPWWEIGEGIHTVKLLSTDFCGNTENTEFTVRVDLTPPEITFPTLRANYLTSEELVADWVATDALSGVDETWAELDGVPVTDGQVLDLGALAGPHVLTVHASDVAGNLAEEEYRFEVWIDTETYAKPVNIQTKTNGGGLMIAVEFPALYDVGAVDLSTCRLSIGASIDLEADDPVVGATATLDGVLLTGVGDHDADGVPDSMIKFDKAAFADAVAGQTGDVQAVVWGGLLPDGTPRFVGVVTIAVFTPPK